MPSEEHEESVKGAEEREWLDGCGGQVGRRKKIWRKVLFIYGEPTGVRVGLSGSNKTT